MTPEMLWVLFGAIVIVSMSLDLGVFHRQAHVIRLREALAWSAVWILLAVVLAAATYFVMGPASAAEYAACYLTEKALSVDNLFVFLVVFRFFGVAAIDQHRVLFWGILGALAMRAIFIFIGVELVERFAWTSYFLGALLVYTGAKLAFTHGKEVHPERNPVLRFARRFLRVTSEMDGSRFFTRRDGVLFATPLFLALLVVETTDVVFAIDSVPAALAISHDRFVLYSSNVMAICGLRALYFALAGVMDMFRYLQHGLSAILVFVGVKMVLAHHYKIPVPIALGTVAGILAISIVASLLVHPKASS